MTEAHAPIRLLMLGTVNHPHVEHLADAMRERGLQLLVAGDVEPSLPASRLPDAGVEVQEAPRARRRTVRGLVSHVIWIRRLVRDFRPAVVHAHWFPGFGFFAVLARARPLVVMAWGSDVYRANLRQELVNRYVARRADLVMTDSSALLGRLEALGASADRTLLVNWGVDLEAFSPPEGERRELRGRLGFGDGPVILSPRSLAPVYNIPVILAAFERLLERIPDAELVLKHMAVTPGELGDLPHPDRVHLVGHVPYEQMADYYRAADVCVSIPSSDSSPRSAWEALGCGCPLVLSDLPWVHELIEPGRHAAVVPIDADAVAAAVERLLTDGEHAARMRAEGRALVERHRDRNAEMERLAGAYADLARDAQPGASTSRRATERKRS
jgi:glycosyltransferase involved in cell wall biosynthesis